MKAELYHDNFQNYKRYGIPKAQLVIADIPYNIGVNAYGSNPAWYEGGDNKNGESKHAKSAFFNGDGDFKIAEYMHFCSKMLIKEPKEKGKAPAMIVFCAFEQIPTVVEYGKKYGFMNYYPLFFIKNYSAQVLKANMKIVGATEFAVVLYRDKLPKFNNGRQMGEDGKPIRGTGKMIFDWVIWDAYVCETLIACVRDGGDYVDIGDVEANIKSEKPRQWTIRRLRELGMK